MKSTSLPPTVKLTENSVQAGVGIPPASACFIFIVFCLDKAMADPVDISLATTLSVIQHLESGVKKLDREIAEIGGIDRFPDHHALAKIHVANPNRTKSS